MRYTKWSQATCYILHEPHTVCADWELHLAAGWQLWAGACWPCPCRAFAYLSETSQLSSVQPSQCSKC